MLQQSSSTALSTKEGLQQYNHKYIKQTTCSLLQREHTALAKLLFNCTLNNQAYLHYQHWGHVMNNCMGVLRTLHWEPHCTLILSLSYWQKFHVTNNWWCYCCGDT